MAQLDQFQYDYDVFLSYNRADTQSVKQIATRLASEGHVYPFLDEWCLIPGDPWQEAIEEALDRSATCVVFLGQVGIGPWENEEMRSALDDRVRDKSIRVIPVLLPGADPQDPKTLPRFLRRLSWVDYRNGVEDEEAFRLLIAGIFGQQPGRPTDQDKGFAVQRRTLKPRIVHPLHPVSDFQDRPELEAIRTFWMRENAPGIISLVGIGGAGKTALVTRFLQELPSSGITHAAVIKNQDMPAPAGVFIWSLYDLPNVDQFISSLFEYLTGRPETSGRTINTTSQLVQFLEASSLGRILIVIDGMEVVQEDRRTGQAFGMLRDSSMRHLLRRLAQGISDVRVFVTSRFPVPDLMPFLKSGYQQVDTDQLDMNSARALLRARGVRGSRSEIDELIRDFGSHALTLDHLGSLLRDFFGGKASSAGELPALDEIGGESASDYQAYRLARIFEHYEQQLPADELSVLQKLCVFRLPVEANVLAEMFADSEKSGKTSPKGRIRFLEILQRLKSRRLIALQEQGGAKWCSVHPSIRDHFYRSLGETSTKVHEQVSRHLVSLVERPGGDRLPLDTYRLDLLEELVYHTLSSGVSRDAYYYYWSLLGGYEHLAWRVGAFHRGLRLTRAFPTGVDHSGMEIQHDRALFSLQVGATSEAEHLLKGLLATLESHGANEYTWWRGERNFYGHTVQQCLCDTLVLLGKTKEAEKFADDLVNIYQPVLIEQRSDRARRRRYESENEEVPSFYYDAIRWGSNPFARRAVARGLLGKINEALEDFESALKFKQIISSELQPSGWVALQHASLLIRVGRFTTARAVLDYSRRRSLPKMNSLLAVGCDLVLSDLLRLRGKYDDAWKYLKPSLAWALETGQQEIYCRANLNVARLRLAQNELAEAWFALQEALTVAIECGLKLYEIDCLTTGARIRLQQHDLQKSKEMSEKALSLASEEECSYVWGQGNSLNVLGEVLIELGNIDEARQSLLTALELRKKSQDPRVINTEKLLSQIDR